MSTQVATTERPEIASLSQQLRNDLPSVNVGFNDSRSFELMQRIARAFSASSLVPQAYRGNTPAAIGNCMIALNLARRIGADPLMVMQNLNIVQGRPAWSSQFLIASVNTCGRFSALRFEFFGEPGSDDYGCRARAVEKETGEVLVGSDVTLGLAKKEGWYGRNGSKWQTMQQQMFMYRSGAWWVKAYAPELSLGLMTADEVNDISDTPREETRSFVDVEPAASPQSINERLDQFAQNGNGEPSADETESSASSSRVEEAESEEAVSATRAAPKESAPSEGVEPPPPPGTDSADSAPIEQMSASEADAYERGRAARQSNYGRAAPRNFKGKEPEMKAFYRGFDDQNAEMKAEENGTV